jgi:hypothetical protein
MRFALLAAGCGPHPLDMTIKISQNSSERRLEDIRNWTGSITCRRFYEDSHQLARYFATNHRQ